MLHMYGVQAVSLWKVRELKRKEAKERDKLLISKLSAQLCHTWVCMVYVTSQTHCASSYFPCTQVYGINSAGVQRLHMY